MEEIWKPVVGYEGLYEISNLGKVKSLKYGKERILKSSKNKVGYLMVSLFKDGKHKIYKVHRLVASAFIPNNDLFKTEVNHKDENKENNNIENLEWCTHKYNINYGTRIEKISKQVNQYDLAGNFIQSFQSTMEIERQLGFDNNHISECCNGKRKTAYGFLWEYA